MGTVLKMVCIYHYSGQADICTGGNQYRFETHGIYVANVLPARGVVRSDEVYQLRRCLC